MHELTLAATKIQHPLGAYAAQHRGDARDAFVVQAQRRLDGCLFGRVLLLGRVRIEGVVRRQTREGLAGQVPLALEVPLGDEFMSRMGRKPPFAPREQLVDLVAP